MKFILVSIVLAFIYHKLSERIRNSYFDFAVFLLLIATHFIWDYYFLPIEILIALSGVNVISIFLKKLQRNSNL
ncbi:TPA: hypothetical protein VAR29_000323 [Streptococcus agalactiae]|uniref:hypothetical protein n=1 Tax=Streptococcus mitis TaxID=28037 RepID=UPI001CBFA0DC|nr:hypothetical protein [Streptococcus mitis]HEO2846895.1 hypothetical protein [Streptococcus agalactiae]